MRISTSVSTALLLLPALALAGCGEPEAAEMPPGTEAMEAEVQTEGGAEVPAFSEEVRTAFTSPEDTATGVAGTLRLLVPTEAAPDEAAPRLHVELAGLVPGTEYAWHVYDGACGVEGGGLVFPVTNAPGRPGFTSPLQADADGRAEAEVATPPLQDLWVEAGNYSIRVFEDTGVEAGPMVACAIL